MKSPLVTPAKVMRFSVRIVKDPRTADTGGVQHREERARGGVGPEEGAVRSPAAGGADVPGELRATQQFVSVAVAAADAERS